MQKNNTTYVGIDIGTTNTRVAIGYLDEQSAQPTLIGVGSAKTQGMRKGTIINVSEVAQAISRAVDEAERISGQQVDAATVSINGSHVVGIDSQAQVAISGNDHEISVDDLERVEEAATVIQLPANREILQVFARSYSLDGQQNIKEPLGMSGVRLEVDAHIVTASSQVVKNIDRTLDTAAIYVNHRIMAGLAAAESTLDDKNRETGSVVIDVGAATTSVAVFEEDDVIHVAVIPIGSDNITNDLAIGLRTDIDVADAVKINFASAKKHGKSKKQVSLSLNDTEHSFAQSEIDDIVRARLDELFELVNDELKKVNRAGKLPGGAVLVGGGALLPDLAHFVKEKLALPARVAKPKSSAVISESADSPEFAAAVGLMLLDMQLSSLHEHSGSSSRFSMPSVGLGGLSSGVKKFLSRFRT